MTTTSIMVTIFLQQLLLPTLIQYGERSFMMKSCYWSGTLRIHHVMMIVSPHSVTKTGTKEIRGPVE